MVRSPIDEPLLTLAESQAGMLTRAQLRAAGISHAVVRGRLVSQWRAVLPGVVQLSRAPLDEHARYLAATLMAGPEAVITGVAAARLLGLTSAGTPQVVDLLVPAHRAPRTASFVRVCRTHRMPHARRQLGPLPVALPARAVADACRTSADTRFAEALVIEAVQRRTTTLTLLHDELYAGPRQRSAVLRAGIAAAATGAWSVAEHDLVRVVGRSTVLPTPVLNPRLVGPDGGQLPTPDLWFDDVGLAVQVHSHAYHADGDAWTRTVRADSALAEAGVTRVALTPREIRTAPDEVLARLERTYLSMKDRPRTAVRATPRPLH